MMKPKIRFQRANYVVADIDRSLTLYRDILGFDVVFLKPSDPGNYSYEIFKIDADEPMRFAVLRTETQANVMALTEVPGVKPFDGTPLRAGIILEDQDIFESVKKAKALGLTVYGEDKLITKDGREGVEYGIVDFDGNLVVLYLIQKDKT